MANPSPPAGGFTPGNFRVGRAFSRAWSVFWRNILKLSLVTGITALPKLVFPGPGLGNPFANSQRSFFAIALIVLLNLFAEAVIFYGAFQDMRRRPVNLNDGVRVGLHRFFPLIGLVLVWLLVMFGLALITGLLFAVPGLKYAIPLMIVPFAMIFLTWSVAGPVCVVERAGPLDSLDRSRELTKGHRWKVLGLLLLALIPAFVGGIVSGIADAVAVLAPAGDLSTAAVQAIGLIWHAMWSAFFWVILVVVYHDLRVAKEGNRYRSDRGRL
jgi:hypothetical protein